MPATCTTILSLIYLLLRTFNTAFVSAIYYMTTESSGNAYETVSKRLRSEPCLALRPAKCPADVKLLIPGRECGNVLLGKGCPTPLGTVTNECGGTVEWNVSGEK